MTDCILWEGATTKNGYGSVRHNDKTVYVHRLVWEQTWGPIPKGMHVCHSCDVRNCYNIEHLFLGSQKENLEDMRSKGRDCTPPHVPGQRCGKAKLTWDAVTYIRSSNDTTSEMASKYGVSSSAIRRIRSGITWKQEYAPA